MRDKTVPARDSVYPPRFYILSFVALMSVFFGIVFALVPIVKAQNTLAHGSVSPIVIKTSNVHQYGVVSINEVAFVLPQSGIDGFNWGDTATFDWQDPWTVFGAGLWHARHANGDANVINNKPILIGETGSAPSQASYSQQKWIGDLVSWLNDTENSDVIGFVWFDHLKGDELDLGEGMTNWRIDASQETVDAMKDALANRR